MLAFSAGYVISPKFLWTDEHIFVKSCSLCYVDILQSVRYNVSNLTICGGLWLVIKEQEPYDHVYQRVFFPLILLYFLLFMRGKILPVYCFVYANQEREALIMEENRRLGFEIKTLSNLLKREIGSSRGGKYVANATGTNGFVIGYLAENADRDVFQRDLEKKFSVRRSTMSNIIMRMEKKGFLGRVPVEYDARLKKLILTEKGWEIHATMESAVTDAEKKLTRGLSEEEIELLFSLLGRLRRNLEDGKRNKNG